LTTTTRNGLFHPTIQMSGSGYGDPAKLADAIALAKSFKKASGSSQGRNRKKGGS
jgi:hypothetical protein